MTVALPAASKHHRHRPVTSSSSSSSSYPAFVLQFVSEVRYRTLDAALATHPHVVYRLPWLTLLRGKAFIAAHHPETMCTCPSIHPSIDRSTTITS
jgi:hypothetical protein